jgi:hypothetical protein
LKLDYLYLETKQGMLEHVNHDGSALLEPRNLDQLGITVCFQASELFHLPEQTVSEGKKAIKEVKASIRNVKKDIRALIPELVERMSRVCVHHLSRRRLQS